MARTSYDAQIIGYPKRGTAIITKGTDYNYTGKMKRQH
jgi:hypothetical protein